MRPSTDVRGQAERLPTNKEGGEYERMQNMSPWLQGNDRASEEGTGV